MLKRSVTESSVATFSNLSTVTSLGDDSKWENVQEQINSRMKAIKDSFADSSITKLPSLPSINLQALKPDFLQKKASNDKPPGDRAMSSVFGDKSEASSRSRKGSGSSLFIQPTKPHNYLDEALENLYGDIVVMGGYRGSILRSAEPPHRRLWVPIKVGLNIRKANLEVGLELEDEEKMEETIFASGMLSHIGPVDISRRLLKKLKQCRNVRDGKLRVHDYGYDWRLSPHLLSRRLVKFLGALACNQGSKPQGALVIAHSLGGLITRHAINRRPELCSGVLYAGVPHHCVNILGPLRNGDEVLLSSRVLTAQVNFTIRTSFLLLPESGRCFVDRETKEEYPVDFFEVDSWKEYGFSPCITPTLPALNTEPRKGIFASLSEGLPIIGSGSKSAAVNRTVDPEDHTVSMSMNTATPAQNVTIPHDRAVSYLRRVLNETKTFKHELAHRPSHQEHNAYPPVTILFSNNIPTVYGARVASREAIRHADAYDDLAFASGDGVVLARAAMPQEGVPGRERRQGEERTGPSWSSR